MKQILFTIFILFLLANKNCFCLFCSDGDTKSACHDLNIDPSSDDEYRCCWMKMEYESSVLEGITGGALGEYGTCEEIEFQKYEEIVKSASPGVKYDIDCSSKYLVTASLIILSLLL